MNSADERHVQRMQRKKALFDERVASAQTRRGVVVLHTGAGKGKSTAAFGTLARALGHGLKVAVVQFVKSRSDTGEEAFFRRCEGVRWHVMGEGFPWETQDAARDAAAARAAWELARTYLADPAIDLLVLDELTYAFKYGWLDVEQVVAELRARPAMQHVLITGRAAPQALIEAADTASEAVMLKHAYRQGIAAMPGIEY